MFHPRNRELHFYIFQSFYTINIFLASVTFLYVGVFNVYYHALELIQEQTNKDTWKAVLLLMSFVATYRVTFARWNAIRSRVFCWQPPVDENRCCAHLKYAPSAVWECFRLSQCYCGSAEIRTQQNEKWILLLLVWCLLSYRNFFFFSSTTLCSCKCVFPLGKPCFSTQSVSEPFWMWNPHTSVLKETENISYSEKYDWFVFFKLYSLYILIAHPWLWNKTYDRCHAYDFRFFVIFIYIYIF